jgi:hypothetical protein
MEALNNAARAAGYAMAGSDDLYDDRRRDVLIEGELVEMPARQTGELALPRASLPARQHRSGDWLRSLTSLFGGRAPA